MTVKQILKMVYGSEEMRIEIEKKLIELRNRANIDYNYLTREVLEKVLLNDSFYLMNRDLQYVSDKYFRHIH